MESRRPEHLNHMRQPKTLEAGDAITIDARGCVRLTFITDGSATLTWSRVDSIHADAHDSDTTDVTSGSVDTVEVDWPYYRISSAGGETRAALV